MFIKKLIFTAFIVSHSMQPIHAIAFSENTVLQFVIDHKTLLKKAAIVGGIAFTAYHAFKKLIETEEKQIAVFEDDVVIKQVSSKYITALLPCSFKMYKQGKYIGLIICMRSSKTQCMLGNFIISKIQRNKGYGKKLLKTVIDMLIQDGCNEIYLDVEPFESDATGAGKPLPIGPEKDALFQTLITFYEHNGFERIETEAAQNKLLYFKFMPLHYPMQYKIG